MTIFWCQRLFRVTVFWSRGLFRVTVFWSLGLFRVTIFWSRCLFRVTVFWCRGLFRVTIFWFQLVREIFRKNKFWGWKKYCWEFLIMFWGFQPSPFNISKVFPRWHNPFKFDPVVYLAWFWTVCNKDLRTAFEDFLIWVTNFRNCLTRSFLMWRNPTVQVYCSFLSLVELSW